MKFGDKAKLTDELWNELKNIIKNEGFWLNKDLNLLENKFLCLQYSKIVGIDTYWIASLTEKLTDTCGGVGTTSWKSNFNSWSFWIDHKAVSGDVPKEILLDDYHGADKAKWPSDWKIIVPKRMIIFRIDKNVLPYEDIKIKQIQSGASCLICKDFNPWMEQNSFCYVCKDDPRNQFKIEEIYKNLSILKAL